MSTILRLKRWDSSVTHVGVLGPLMVVQRRMIQKDIPAFVVTVWLEKVGSIRIARSLDVSGGFAYGCPCWIEGSL